MVVKEDIKHYIKHITRVEDEEEDGGLIQAITIKMEGDAFVTGIYNSSATPAARIVKALDELLKIDGTNHVIMGDLNARYKLWDSENNKVGQAIVEWQKKAKLRINASQTPSYPTKQGAKGKPTKPSSIDILIHNMRTDTEVKTIPAIQRPGGSDHLAIKAIIDPKTARERPQTRVPKTMFGSKPATEEVGTRYAATMLMLARAVKETNKDPLEDDATQLEEEIRGPWTERVNARHRNHPVPWWTNELEKKKRKEHKLFLQWKRAIGNGTLTRKLHAAQRYYKREKRRAAACFARRTLD